MDVALGVLLGLALAASLVAGWRLVRAPRVQDPSSDAMQGAVHAATSLLPHLRRGLGEASAPPAAPHLRVLTGASAVALADPQRLLAFDGAGADHHRPGDPLAALAGEVRDDRLRVEPRLRCDHPGCPLQSAIVAPLMVQEERVGALVAFYAHAGRVRVEESRVVGEAAALVAAMIELSEMEAQGERLARAELRALRAQISPHFIYNALAAVASFIHSRPEEARELLTEFAEFIRYAFARQRAYATVADELRYVEKYLRLEQARFGERLTVRVQVDPEVLQAVLPCCRCSRWSRTPCATASRARPRAARSRSRASTSASTWRCACPTTATGSTRSVRAPRSPATARGSGSATCTGACGRRSARATASRSSPSRAAARPS